MAQERLETFLECGILAHGFMRLRCDECAHTGDDKLKRLLDKIVVRLMRMLIRRLQPRGHEAC